MEINVEMPAQIASLAPFEIGELAPLSVVDPARLASYIGLSIQVCFGPPPRSEK